MPPSGIPPGPDLDRTPAARPTGRSTGCPTGRRRRPGRCRAVLTIAVLATAAAVLGRFSPAHAQSPGAYAPEADTVRVDAGEIDTSGVDTTALADDLPNPYGTGLGLEVLITNSGFGLGGYIRRAVGTRTSFLVEISIGTEKNEREVKFVGLQRSYIPDKANYFLRMPVKLGLQRRLFEEDIEDNFRPYLQFSTGPTLGWIYPYFDDENANGSFDDGERQYDGFGSLFKGSFRFGLGGTIGLGAYFGESKRLAQGVRIAYSFNYFFDDIQLLEPEDQIRPERFFDTPTISITFGRLN